MENNQPHIFYQLRELDPDRAFLSLFVPASFRKSVQILDLWNAEISRIREEVRDPHMGLIRLQWWREEILRIYDKGRSDNHPVLSLLSEVIPAHGLAFDDFDRMLHARELEFEGRAPESFDELFSYIDGTHGVLMKMKGLILDRAPEDSQNVARFYSLIGLVRSVPFHGSLGHVMMPQINVSDVKPHSKLLINVVGEVCSVEKPDHLQTRYLRAVQALTQLHLKQIKRAGFDPFHIQPVPFKEFQVWIKAF